MDAVTVSKMQRITSWDHVTPFAGKVVAYEIDPLYLDASKGYTIGRLHFGYIAEHANTWYEEPLYVGGWRSLEKGYHMSRLLNPQDEPKNFGLIASKLNFMALSMRFATKEELATIEEAINDNKAQFEFIPSKERMYQILSTPLA